MASWAVFSRIPSRLEAQLGRRAVGPFVDLYVQIEILANLMVYLGAFSFMCFPEDSKDFQLERAEQLRNYYRNLY